MRAETGQLDSLAKTTHDEVSKMIAKRDNEYNTAMTNIHNKFVQMDVDIGQVKAGASNSPSQPLYKDYNKPLTEYKAISELQTLSNDKPIFSDWKVKMRDAFEQVYRDQEFPEILEFLESFNIGIKGNESMPDLIDHAELEHGIGRPNEYWSEISKDLKSMLLKYTNQRAKRF